MSEHIYYLHGSGGNILVSIGDDGIVLVDNEFASLSERLVDSIAQLQSGAIRFVLKP